MNATVLELKQKVEEIRQTYMEKRRTNKIKWMTSDKEATELNRH